MLLIKVFFKLRLKLIISAGGGAGFIPVIFYRLFNIKSVLLEQNVIMGKANKFLLNFAEKAYLSFPCINVKNTEKLKVTGNPVKESLTKKITKEDALEKLKLQKDKFTILLLGGSQGAKKINEFAIEIIPLLHKKNPDLQVIHLTGKTMLKECRSLYNSLGINYFCEEFSDDMLSIYTVSDFAVSRSGGGAISEILLYKIPVLFIPFPHAAEKHQHANASFIVKNNAGWMIDENDIGSITTKDFILNIINNKPELEKIKNNQALLARPESGEEIAGDIMDLLKL